jgi:hypothetical protein
MTPSDFTAAVKEAEAKLAACRPLSRHERILLLAAKLVGQSTRKETRYGQS